MVCCDLDLLRCLQQLMNNSVHVLDKLSLRGYKYVFAICENTELSIKAHKIIGNLNYLYMLYEQMKCVFRNEEVQVTTNRLAQTQSTNTSLSTLLVRLNKHK